MFGVVQTTTSIFVFFFGLHSCFEVILSAEESRNDLQLLNDLWRREESPTEELHNELQWQSLEAQRTTLKLAIFNRILDGNPIEGSTMSE